MAQVVEHILGKDEVGSSSLPNSSRKRKTRESVSFLFQLNPPLRVGEILLRNVKSSLRSDEIAAAVGGFNFICIADFIQATLGFHREQSAQFHYLLATPPLLCYTTHRR